MTTADCLALEKDQSLLKAKAKGSAVRLTFLEPKWDETGKILMVRTGTVLGLLTLVRASQELQRVDGPGSFNQPVQTLAIREASSLKAALGEVSRPGLADGGGDHVQSGHDCQWPQGLKGSRVIRAPPKLA